MKTHYSISELLEMNLEKFPKTNRAILYKVEREKWSFIEASCQGGKNGKRREYAPPPEVLKLIQAKKLNEVLGGLSDLPAPLSSSEEKSSEAAGLPSPDVRGGELTIGVADGSTEQQRLCESARRGVLSAVERVMAESGVSKEAAMTTVLTQAKMPGFEHIAKLFSLAADGRGGGGKLPSVRTIKRWFAARESNSLAPKSRTEDMNVPSWLPVFLECYRLPMKPSVSEAYRLFVNRLEEGYLFRPQVMRTVRRGEVSLFSNTYYSAELMEFNGETVRVGYDVQDALWVWIYDDIGRLICKAEWHGNSTDYMPVSVLERAEDKRNDERLKRNELQQQNILKERRVPTIEHQDSVNIGGMVLDMSQIKAKAAALAERRNREDDVVVEVAAVKAVENRNLIILARHSQSRQALRMRTSCQYRRLAHLRHQTIANRRIIGKHTLRTRRQSLTKTCR
ncbi:TPA: Mu transposase C-terminal domain-containing protein [Neisseria subflava]